MMDGKIRPLRRQLAEIEELMRSTVIVFQNHGNGEAILALLDTASVLTRKLRATIDSIEKKINRAKDRKFEYLVNAQVRNEIILIASSFFHG